MAKEMNDLSLQDNDNNGIDMKCHLRQEPAASASVVTNTPASTRVENSKFIDQCLLEMDHYLERIPSKSAYVIGQELDEDYIRNTTLRRSFLYASYYNPKHAALRYIEWLEWKLELFGPTKLCQNIDLQGLDQDTIQMIQSNRLQLLSTGGGTVLLDQTSQHMKLFRSTESMLKLYWYKLMSLIDLDDEEDDVPTNDVVLVVNCLDDDDGDSTTMAEVEKEDEPQVTEPCTMLNVLLLGETHTSGGDRNKQPTMYWQIPSILSCLPIRIEQIHCCVNDSILSQVLGKMLMERQRKQRYLPKDSKSPIHIHYGSATVCQEILEKEYGLSPSSNQANWLSGVASLKEPPCLSDDSIGVPQEMKLVDQRNDSSKNDQLQQVQSNDKLLTQPQGHVMMSNPSCTCPISRLIDSFRRRRRCRHRNHPDLQSRSLSPNPTGSTHRLNVMMSPLDGSSCKRRKSLPTTLDEQRSFQATTSGTKKVISMSNDDQEQETVRKPCDVFKNLRLLSNAVVVRTARVKASQDEDLSRKSGSTSGGSALRSTTGKIITTNAANHIISSSSERSEDDDTEIGTSMSLFQRKKADDRSNMAMSTLRKLSLLRRRQRQLLISQSLNVRSRLGGCTPVRIAEDDDDDDDEISSTTRRASLELLQFLRQHPKCFKVSVKNFYIWLVQYQKPPHTSIVTIQDLFMACKRDPQFVTLMQRNGMKGYKRGPFLKAIQQAARATRQKVPPTTTTATAVALPSGMTTLSASTMASSPDRNQGTEDGSYIKQGRVNSAF